MQTETDYTIIADLVALMPEIPADTIISRTIFEDHQIKGTLFGFASGQELTEHTASRPALLHFLSGDGQLTLGDDSFVAQAGTWVHMPANLVHSIKARGPMVMLLILLR